jgi:hypothetical protein
MKAERLLDVGPALFGGYRVALLSGMRCDGQALIETANDVAACAALLGVRVLTSDERIVQACTALGVATALPPPVRQESMAI